MKRVLTVFFAFFFAMNIFAQESEADALVYLEANGQSLSFYDLSSGENYRYVYNVGDIPNKLYFYQNNVFIVCSGNFTEGNTELMIIPSYAFFEYSINQDSTVFEQTAITVPLETFGNAWDVVGLTDSTVLVTLSAASKFQIVNFHTGEIVNTIEDNIDGNPQGACEVDENYVAVAMADWGFGTSGNTVAFVNKATGEVEQTIVLRKNVVDVMQLTNGDLLATTWGTWTGEDNYGTVSYIDASSRGVTHTWYPADSSKAYRIVQMNDRYVHLNSYAGDFSTVTAVLDLENFTDTTATEGFWSKHIIGKVNDNLLVQDSLGVGIYSQEGDLLGSIDYIYPIDIMEITYDAMLGVDDDVNNVANFKLSQNYPNPFNPTTTIMYSLPVTRGVERARQGVTVSLQVFNSLGQKVAVLVNKEQVPGNYTVQFNAKNLPSGVYFYTLRAGNFVATKKMILMK